MRTTSARPSWAVGVERDQARCRAASAITTSDEELVPRALRFQPDRVDAQEQILERVTGYVDRIDNGQAEDTFHRCRARISAVNVYGSYCDLGVP